MDDDQRRWAVQAWYEQDSAFTRIGLHLIIAKQDYAYWRPPARYHYFYRSRTGRIKLNDIGVYGKVPGKPMQRLNWPTSYLPLAAAGTSRYALVVTAGGLSCAGQRQVGAGPGMLTFRCGSGRVAATARGGRQPLAKATGLVDRPARPVIDATAGLGRMALCWPPLALPANPAGTFAGLPCLLRDGLGGPLPATKRLP